MYLSDLSAGAELTEQIQDLVVQRSGESSIKTHTVLRENLLNIYINDVLTMKVICCASDLPQLVMGRLLTEGIITSEKDVDAVYICENASRAKVFLSRNRACEQTPQNCAPVRGQTSKESNETDRTMAEMPDYEERIHADGFEKVADGRKSRFVETTASCCTGNHLLNVLFVTERDLRPVKHFRWENAWIFDLADRFAQGSVLHDQTISTHSCLLSYRGAIVYECEDVGRHNALDKAIGYALLNEIHLDECIAYTSGRVPTDMTVKAIRAGLPVLASKARPTAEAIALAQQYGLTLIGNARKDSFRIY